MKFFSISLIAVFFIISLISPSEAANPKETLQMIKYMDSITEEIMPIIENSRQVMTDYLNEKTTKEKTVRTIQKSKAEIMAIQSSMNRYKNNEKLSVFEKNYRNSLDILINITEKQLKFIDKNSLDKTLVKNITLVQTKDLYSFLEKYSIAEKKLLGELSFEEDASGIYEYLNWRKDMSAIADKNRSLALKAELALIDFYFSEDISKVREDIKNILAQTSEITKEYSKKEYNEKLTPLHELLKSGAMESESLIKAIGNFIDDSSEENLSAMESHINKSKEIAQELKKQTTVYINSLAP